MNDYIGSTPTIILHGSIDSILFENSWRLGEVPDIWKRANTYL